MRPCSAHAARYSPFSVTFAWVQVSPDRYQRTGSFAPLSACGGRKMERVMSVEVAAGAGGTPSSPPPCDMLSEMMSILDRDLGSCRGLVARIGCAGRLNQKQL